MKKFIGITLLFFERKNNKYIAFLQSYILESNDWDDLQEKITKITNSEKALIYLGMEDIYYVSGPFGEKEVLGKSYIDELIKIKDAKSLLLKQKDYTCNFQDNKKEEKWFLFSLIYFYNDKAIKDKLTISCLTPIFSNNIRNAKSKIKSICETKNFLKKILPFKLDKMSYNNLKYIGIEDISYIEKDVKKGEALEYSFKEYKSLEKIKGLLPSEKKLKKSYKQAMRVYCKVVKRW